MATDNVLKEYSDSIKLLKHQCFDAGLSEEEFRNLYFNSLESLHSKQHKQSRTMIMKKHKLLLIGMLMAGFCIYKYATLYSYIICNLQDYIYPGLRFLRKLSIPFISLFPSLSEYYHETCIIQNPFFTIADMDCWPCSTVNNVREIYKPTKPVNSQQISPFVYLTDQQVINMIALKDIYFQNKQLFDKEAKFNSMPLARILRQYIPRPKVVPKFGQSTERFIIMDSSKKSFKVPDTECTFSFLLSLSGDRNVHLVPAEECKHQCKSLKVELKETFLLWYNWWYWRPVIQPTSSNETFIAHVGSYC
ncbi:unnamed protein product [Diatraea saccharalis]|uniref:Uncharacterized protein n=1 Tax=Diatraea saccharalis TaxID=40085 RepID=A0A9N9R984_9NEOP|nr:unnamed protein product [Diatraea saccharalis]